MQNKIITMLRLQDEMNLIVNPNWKTAGYKWLRAVMVEGVEGLEHHGYKWWKKQECDMAQLRMELIDIFHFAISKAIEDGAGKSEEMVAEEIALYFKDDLMDIVFFGEVFDRDQPLIEDLDLMVGMAAFGYFSFGLFSNIMNKTGLTFDELFKTYVSKNVLNRFRQKNGYKTGEYVKDWSALKLEKSVVEGRALEDNDHLHDLMKIVPSDKEGENYAQRLEFLLQLRYVDVCKANRKFIAKELTDTALGNSYCGSALYAVKDFPELSGDEIACVLRYINGSQKGIDHVTLHDIAIKVSRSL